MNIRAVGEGISIRLNAATQREGQAGQKFYFEPGVLADLTKGQKFNQGSIEVHPEFGVSIYLGHRKSKPQAVKPQGVNNHEP